MLKTILLSLLILFNVMVVAQTMTIKEIDKKMIEVRDLKDSGGKDIIEIMTKTFEDSQKNNYNIGAIKSLIVIAHYSYNLGKYEDVFKYASQGEELAYKENDPQFIAELLQLKAQGYSELNFLEQAEETYKKALAYSDKIENEDQKNFRKGFLNSALANNMQKEKDPNDSVLNHFQKSIFYYEKLPDSFPNKKIVMSLAYSNIGRIYYWKGDKNALAVANIRKSIELNDLKDGNELLNGYNFSALGDIYRKENKFDSSLISYQKSLRIEKKLNNPYLLKEIYKGLSETFKEENNADSAQFYLQKYVTVKDSLSAVEMKSVKIPLNQILGEKDNEFNQSRRNIIIISCIIIAISLVLGIIGIRNSIKSKKNYRQLIQKLKTEEEQKSKILSVISEPLKAEEYEKEEVKNDNSIKISEKKEDEILNNLNLFEQNNQFTDPDLNMSILAGMLNTNPRYLSEIIKREKGKSYNQYMNEVRINYIVNLLYKEEKFRNYKISYLANYCGFTSRNVFASVFKKETGITPSSFISQLKRDDSEQ